MISTSSFIWRRLLTGFLIAATVATAAGTVKLVRQAGRYRSNLRGVEESTHPSIRGRDLLAADLYEVVVPSPSLSARTPLIALFIGSDCASCIVAATKWVAAVTTQKAGRPKLILVVPPEGPGELDRDLSDRPPTLRIRNLERFCIRTGIVGVPTSIVFGDGGDVIAIATGEPSEQFVQTAIDFLDQKSHSYPSIQATGHGSGYQALLLRRPETTDIR